MKKKFLKETYENSVQYENKLLMYNSFKKYTFVLTWLLFSSFFFCFCFRFYTSSHTKELKDEIDKKTVNNCSGLKSYIANYKKYGKAPVVIHFHYTVYRNFTVITV